MTKTKKVFTEYIIETTGVMQIYATYTVKAKTEEQAIEIATTKFEDEFEFDLVGADASDKYIEYVSGVVVDSEDE